MSFVVKGFSTIRISTTNVSQSRDWYKLFFRIDPVEDYESFVSFKIDGICLDISLADARSPSSPGGSVGYWLVDNLEQAISHAVTLGGEVYRGPLRVEEIQRTIVQIKDPIGNIIGFEADF